MIKKLVCVLIMSAFLMVSSVSYAASDDVLTGMGKKLFIGVVNIATGWVEIPAQIVKGYNRGGFGKKKNKVSGVVGGVFKGIGNGIGRTLSGVMDVAGFWAADPESNEGIGLHLDAEYAWEEGTAYDMFDPNFMDATIIPIGKKLFRGVGNTVFGVVEIPGQIVKGVKDKSVDFGIIKGLWYFASREMDGVADISTFYFAGPKDTKGMAFDEKWPWSALGDSVK